MCAKNELDITTLNDERKFIEEILHQRFHYFLIFFALTLGGAVSAKTQLLFQLILTLGTFVSLFLSLTIHRSFCKHLILRNALKENLPSHAAVWDDSIARKECKIKCLFSVVWIPGFFIPYLCTSMLLLGSILSWCSILKYSLN